MEFDKEAKRQNKISATAASQEPPNSRPLPCRPCCSACRRSSPPSMPSDSPPATDTYSPQGTACSCCCLLLHSCPHHRLSATTRPQRIWREARVQPSPHDKLQNPIVRRGCRTLAAAGGARSSIGAGLALLWRSRAVPAAVATGTQLQCPTGIVSHLLIVDLHAPASPDSWCC